MTVYNLRQLLRDLPDQMPVLLFTGANEAMARPSAQYTGLVQSGPPCTESGEILYEEEAGIPQEFFLISPEGALDPKLSVIEGEVNV